MIKQTYEKGSYVVYGTDGICVIDDVTEMSFMAGVEKSRYYVLKPEHSSDSKVYVPAGNEKLMSKLRPLLTKQEIDMLLTGIRDKAIEWEPDRRLRTEFFHGILAKGLVAADEHHQQHSHKGKEKGQGRKIPFSFPGIR